MAKEFGGQCNLRMDDTNPSKESDEYAESIKQDIRWLGFDWGEGFYSAANLFDEMYAIAENLIASDGGLDEAHALLTGALAHYRRQGADLVVADTETLLARLAERRGDLAGALSHFRQASSAKAAAERDARERRLAYLQVQFDTRLKEQQIGLLEAERELAAVQRSADRRRQFRAVLDDGETRRGLQRLAPSASRQRGRRHPDGDGLRPRCRRRHSRQC